MQSQIYIFFSHIVVFLYDWVRRATSTDTCVYVCKCVRLRSLQARSTDRTIGHQKLFFCHGKMDAKRTEGTDEVSRDARQKKVRVCLCLRTIIKQRVSNQRFLLSQSWRLQSRTILCCFSPAGGQGLKALKTTGYTARARTHRINSFVQGSYSKTKSEQK